jgi:replicative DNA helicase
MDSGREGPAAVQTADERWREIADLPLYMVGGPLTMPQIEAVATCLVARYGVKFLILDHLHYIRPSRHNASRYQEVSEYSATLASMPKKLGISELVLSQLSRRASFEKRRPQLSDLRDSGTIEQDARQVMLLSWNEDLQHHELDLAKNNFGPSGKVVPVQRLDGYQRFDEISVHA